MIEKKIIIGFQNGANSAIYTQNFISVKTTPHTIGSNFDKQNIHPPVLWMSDRGWAKIGKKVNLSYGGLGIVLHNRAVIGDNVSIGTCVTIGGTTKIFGVPVISENTIISTGAKILGAIKIGKNCVIGANAVVLDDISDNCLAVGVPARIIKTNINIKDYRSMNEAISF